jgi:tRNA(fMet)-specific endonuclease VapC
MRLLLDTNILIYLSRDPGFDLLNNIINPEGQEIFISIVSIGELKASALRNRRGKKKWDVVDPIINEAVIVEITESFVDTYAEIDAFSQRKNPSYTDYLFATPRNMGKNDLWIAATAALLGLKLVTTDADFNHLNGVFIEVQHLKPESLIG